MSGPSLADNGGEALRVLSNEKKSDTVVVVPAYREPQGIQTTLDEIREEVNGVNVVVVVRHDGDGDETFGRAMARAPNTILQTSKGKGRAFGDALRHIRGNGSLPSILVLIDADGTYPAQSINTMVNVLQENPNVGMVLGNRFSEPKGKWRFLDPYYVGNRLLSVAHRVLNGVRLRDPLTGLRAVRYRLIRDWEPKAGGFDLEADLNCRVARFGTQVLEIPVTYRPRIGEKKLRLRHGFQILYRMMKCSFDGSPIHESGAETKSSIA
jgi:dolichol-phosphate mannosyltransferase